MKGHANGGVKPCDVAFHLRHSLHPQTAIATATVAAPFAIPCVYRPLRTDFDHHSYAPVHLALHSSGHTARGNPLGPDLHNFRGHAAVDVRHLATDVRHGRQLGLRLALFPVSQKMNQRFEDNLGRSLILQLMERDM